MTTVSGRVSCAQLMANLSKGTVDMQDGEGGERMQEDRPGLALIPVCLLACLCCTRLWGDIWAQCRPDLIMCWELAFAAIPQQQ
jgi:hypothetical protein